jgi:enoyl-CoA hydratase
VTAPHACKPIIAAVNGGALAGGLELVLGCDLVVAGEDAGFGLPEVKRGVVVAQGGELARMFEIAG